MGLEAIFSYLVALIDWYSGFYNFERFHQSLDNKTPGQVYSQNEGVSRHGLVRLSGVIGEPGAKLFESEPVKPTIAAFIQ